MKKLLWLSFFVCLPAFAGSVRVGDVQVGGVIIGARITGLADGVEATDAATVGQVSSGITWVNPIVVPYMQDDSLATPPGSCTVERAYIAAATAGAWTAGHVYECLTAAPTWTDVLGRAVTTGDRFGVTFDTGAGAAGSFAAKDKYIFEITGGTPGAYTYSQTAPVLGLQTTVTGVNGVDFAHVYWYSGTVWVDTTGAGSIVPAAGNGLQKNSGTFSIDTAITVDKTTTQSLSGKTFTGTIPFDTISVKNAGIIKTAPTISSGTIVYDLSLSNVFAVSLNANITTSTVSNCAASGTTSSWQVMFTADGTLRTIVWPSGIVWASGTAPTMTSTNAKRDWIQLQSFDGCTTVFGFVLGQNF